MDYSDLEKLNELKNKGIITEQEFNQQKEKILNGNQSSSNDVTKISQNMGKDNVVVNNTINVGNKGSKKIGFLTVLGYIIGISFLVSGIGILTTGNILGGIFVILAGIIIIPAFNNFLEKQFNFKLSRILRIIIFFVLVGIYSSTISNTTNVISNVETIEKNKDIDISSEKTINGKDWQITIDNIQFSQKVEPPEKNIYYNYYQVDDSDNTYLCIILNCKNISTLDLSASSTASVTVQCDKYTYTSFKAVPDETLGFTYSNITNIRPLTSKKVYFLAEMPKSLADSEEMPIEIKINSENKTYTYKYR